MLSIQESMDLSTINVKKPRVPFHFYIHMDDVSPFLDREAWSSLNSQLRMQCSRQLELQF
uniref:Uncharacterized protein n=1 Tax=Picea glauca TaxID=3330 RepID=A0A101LVD6_PICGL|nr:hypothetical protein ABT39_MTgene2155 [Picea glauca]